MSKFIGYLDKSDGKWVITDFSGKIILSNEVKITNSRPIRGGWISNSLLYLRFKYNNKIYAGTSPGKGMHVKARVTKLKSLGE